MTSNPKKRKHDAPSVPTQPSLDPTDLTLPQSSLYTSLLSFDQRIDELLAEKCIEIQELLLTDSQAQQLHEQRQHWRLNIRAEINEHDDKQHLKLEISGQSNG